MQRTAEVYRKIRNTFRYILSNLNGFDPERDALPFDQMEPLDRFMLLRTAEMAKEVRDWYADFQFHRVYQRINEFCVTDLSAIYFDILKDRLYTFPPRSRARRSAQTAIWRIGEALVRLVAPTMSFTADEVWGFLPPVKDRPASVHLALFPQSEDITGNISSGSGLEQLEQDWGSLLAIRVEVLKALEEARQAKLIGPGLEAQVSITASAPAHLLLQKYQKDLPALFIVSVVRLEPNPAGNGTSGIRVAISRASGQKCERCWNYSIHVGEDSNYPTVCERCSAALREIEAGGDD